MQVQVVSENVVYRLSIVGFAQFFLMFKFSVYVNANAPTLAVASIHF